MKIKIFIWLIIPIIIVSCDYMPALQKDMNKALGFIKDNATQIERNSKNIDRNTEILLKNFKIEVQSGDTTKQGLMMITEFHKAETSDSIKVASKLSERDYSSSSLDFGGFLGGAVDMLGGSAGLMTGGTGLAAILSLGFNYMQSRSKQNLLASSGANEKKLTELKIEYDDIIEDRTRLEKEKTMFEKKVKRWELIAEEAAEANEVEAKKIIKKFKAHEEMA